MTRARGPFRRVWVRIPRTRPRRYRRGWQQVPSWRTRIVEAMRWGLAVTDRIHYEQRRPFDPHAISKKALPIVTDCSGTTTMLYNAAGRPDPNGRNYDGTGWTGTLRAHTPRRRTVRGCKPGDFIVYGDGDGVHVVIVMEAGRDPLVWSHGQEAGPLVTRHSQQVAYHGRPFTCHNGDKL